MASDWLAALLAANQKLHLKIVVSYPCFYPRIALVTLTPDVYFSMKYRKSHCRDTTSIRSIYLHNMISCSAKMIYLYWKSGIVGNDLSIEHWNYIFVSFISSSVFAWKVKLDMFFVFFFTVHLANEVLKYIFYDQTTFFKRSRELLWLTQHLRCWHLISLTTPPY